MTDINNTPVSETPVVPVASAPSFPTLTLEPQQTATLNETSDQLHTMATQVAEAPVVNPGVQAAAQAVQEIDTSMLTEEEKRSVEEFVDKIDVNNTDHVLLYGADAQKKISDFSESALETIRTKDTGEVGDMLVNLVNEIKGFGAAAEKPSGLKGLFWDAKKAVSDMKTKYQKVDANVDVISTQLEKHQVQLLKDVSMFNHLYDMNSQYFKELTMYIIAGEKKLQNVRGGELAELSRKAAQTGDAMDAQKANDLAANCDRFEKKLHDLKLTRQVALQMAPQIRLLQNNDSLLVERIQSTLSNTLPLWKSQMVIALGMHRSQEALKAQNAVTDMTNDLLKKNAEALKIGTIQTAKEAERGIIDLDTLKKTNQDLMDTISEVMRIQQEGRSQRLDAEREMAAMEGDLKKKLLEMH